MRKFAIISNGQICTIWATVCEQDTGTCRSPPNYLAYSCLAPNRNFALRHLRVFFSFAKCPFVRAENFLFSLYSHLCFLVNENCNLNDLGCLNNLRSGTLCNDVIDGKEPCLAIALVLENVNYLKDEYGDDQELNILTNWE